MDLPECDVFEDSLVLSYRENLELITKLVEEGPGYLDKFMDEQAKKDSVIARYIKSLRKKLQRQAESIREERRKGYMSKMKILKRRREAKLKQAEEEVLKLTDEQIALQDRLNEILESALLGDDFVKLVLDTPLDLEEEKEGFAKRLLAKIINMGNLREAAAYTISLIRINPCELVQVNVLAPAAELPEHTLIAECSDSTGTNSASSSPLFTNSERCSTMWV